MLLPPPPPWAAGRAGAVAGRGASVRPVPIVSGGTRPPGPGRAAAGGGGGSPVWAQPAPPPPSPPGPELTPRPRLPFPSPAPGDRRCRGASPQAGRGRHPTSGIRCCWIPLPASPCPFPPAGRPRHTHPGSQPRGCAASPPAGGFPRFLRRRFQRFNFFWGDLLSLPAPGLEAACFSGFKNQ